VHGRPEPAPAPRQPAARERAPRQPAAPRPRRTATPAPEPGPPRLRRRATLTNAARKRTPQAEFKPWIVQLLQEAGGEQHGDQLFAALEERMQEILVPGDFDPVPPQNEARWRYNARWARKALVDDGLLAPPARPGVWELTAAGRAITVD
jgi:hypothetical protein